MLADALIRPLHLARRAIADTDGERALVVGGDGNEGGNHRSIKLTQMGATGAALGALKAT